MWLKLFYGVKKVQAISQFVGLVQSHETSVLCSIDHLNYRGTGFSPKKPPHWMSKSLFYNAGAFSRNTSRFMSILIQLVFEEREVLLLLN